jgi:hypothetical protein
MGKFLGAGLTVVVAVVAFIALVSGLGVWAIEQPMMVANSTKGLIQTPYGQLKQASLVLQTFPNGPDLNPDWEAEHHYSLERPNEPKLNAEDDYQANWVTYGPTTTLSVPAHALVTVTIENYDSATPLLNPFYASPQGTADGQVHVADTPSTPFQAVSSVDPNNVSHTFTIHSIAGLKQPWLYVSVPVTAVPDDRENNPSDNGFPEPVLTQFSFVTGDPGTYIWQCFDPCGFGYDGFGGPMSTKGYMSGTISVVG